MNNRKRTCCLLLSVLVLFVVSPVAYADLYCEFVQTTKGVPGQSDGTKNVESYYTSNAIRTDTGDEIMIMDFDSNTMYRLNTTDKTYVKINMNKIGGMPQMVDEKEAQAIQAMMKKMMGSIQVTPTNEIKKIAGYKCTKYDVAFMMTNSEYWLSKDVKEYEEFKAMSNKMASAFEKNPMLKQMNVAGMMDKLDGFPVQMVMNMMGGTTTTTLKNIKEQSLSKDLFGAPKGYTLKKNAN
ncbi:MAG: hypothetical protein BA872_08760 [Desulfobacterales bacterium C00003060]|nr:MAG: hypothetical protein BA872_08760 [Desulfobacterales bacterium C00003060]OEU84824.1 MAG: hypothetical protein BA865_10675 [Desulfobacterales bacterium S5133MH4]